MSTLSNFGIPGVSAGSILHPKHKNKWRVTFRNIGAGVDSQPLSAQAKIISRPKLNFDPVQLDRYNGRAFVAGKYDFEPINLTVEDDITGQATRVVQEQLQVQQWLIGAEGPFLATGTEGSNYKFETALDMLDGNQTVIEKWIMLGCFFLNVDWGDLDYSTGEQVDITLTIRYDHACQVIGGYNNGNGTAF